MTVLGVSKPTAIRAIEALMSAGILTEKRPAGAGIAASPTRLTSIYFASALSLRMIGEPRSSARADRRFYGRVSAQNYRTIT
jgi:DNA-binding GntR family transcriptional regulator